MIEYLNIIEEIVELKKSIGDLLDIQIKNSDMIVQTREILME